MTIHLSLTDMTSTALDQDDEMARRISQREIVRASLEGKPADRIIARAIPHGEGHDVVWRAMFAIPGTIPDFTRSPDGAILHYDNESDATSSAMAAAIFKFNSPREHLTVHGNNRMGNKAMGDIRPAKPTPEQIAQWMAAADLNASDLVFLLDKPAKRILDWINLADIPHPERLLLETWARFDETVDFAFERTNAAIDEADKKKGR